MTVISCMYIPSVEAAKAIFSNFETNVNSKMWGFQHIDPNTFPYKSVGINEGSIENLAPLET